MKAYAESTTIPLEKTLGELKKLVKARGAVNIMTVDTEQIIGIAFTQDGLTYRMSIPAAKPEEFATINRGAIGFKPRTPAQIEKKVESENARKARALLALIKAKFLAIDEGVTDMAEAFLADVVTPSRATVGETYLPEIRRAALEGRGPGPLALNWGGDR